MSEIKTRKYRCNGCGENKPCYLISNQETHTLDYMQIDDLNCVLDETNQTSYNWEEVQANEVDTMNQIALPMYGAVQQRELFNAILDFTEDLPLVSEDYNRSELWEQFRALNCG